MVSVIIPTILRETFFECYSSVVNQGKLIDEILVGVDLPEGHDKLVALKDYLNKQNIPTYLYVSGGGKGAGFIRERLSRISKSRWIAYIDDDDIFLEKKLEIQIAAAENNSADLVASRFSYIDNNNLIAYKHAPKTLYDNKSDISDYLFKSRKLNLGRNILETSTLLLNSTCIPYVNWNAELKRHQDWDLILRLSRKGYRIHHCPEVLSYIRLPSKSGVSSSCDWQASLEWFNNNRTLFTEKAAVDFLIGQTLRYSIQSRQIKAIIATLKSYKSKQLPSKRSLLLAMSSVIDRNRLSLIFPINKN